MLKDKLEGFKLSVVLRESCELIWGYGHVYKEIHLRSILRKKTQ